jgi:membrane-bound lytic murein transglycosylase MltF
MSLAVVVGAGYCAFYEAPKPVLSHKKLHLEMTPDMIRAQARIMYGQSEIQWKCLDALWTMESHWNFRAKGARTTQGRALGIAQALPATKMKVSGKDYESNPMTQVKWGLKYLKSRYLNKACYALRHELLKGWY